MTRLVVAERDPLLSARVTSRTPLRYAAGADASLDRPAHVRAGSGLAWFGGSLAVIQDDANFVALVDPVTLSVAAVALPAGPGGLRQFDDGRGNKADKLDLESVIVVPLHGRDALVAFGSGSTAARERVVVLRLDAGEAHVELVDARSLYASLRACREFSGSELNIEGVARAGDSLRFFQRGNGSARGAEALDAAADVPLADVAACLAGAPGPCRVVHPTAYDLGNLDGTRLTFTDATAAANGTTFYVATAEASPDAVRDGPVAGSVLGISDGERARYALLVGAGSERFVEKVEGIAVDPSDPTRLFAVLDADDPDRPSELCTIALEGAWLGATSARGR